MKIMDKKVAKGATKPEGFLSLIGIMVRLKETLFTGKISIYISSGLIAQVTREEKVS
jgi:hypothetical protein|tara:strand:- start:2919 stop:3089 length:171 start_codon:yes stop_codon:yes gene_type:complete